jgi:NAD(P)-dependent dehydrogenase (short-subunit alcohol dehydrogenase family)
VGREEGFAGRTAVVTGAGGGMGLEIARRLAAAGAAVTGIDLKRRPDGFAGEYAQGDVSDEGFVRATIETAHERSGRLDYLVNAAGILLFEEDTSLLEIELAVWNRVLAVNLTGSMLTARHAVPAMRASGGGAMVHIASTQCLRGDPAPQDAYQCSKAAILALSKSIAIQFAGDRIRSNALLPSATESPMQARWEGDPESRRRTARGVPLGRVGTTADMAEACLFLLSERASFITGTELIVDGGRTALP